MSLCHRDGSPVDPMEATMGQIPVMTNWLPIRDAEAKGDDEERKDLYMCWSELFAQLSRDLIHWGGMSLEDMQEHLIAFTNSIAQDIGTQKWARNFLVRDRIIPWKEVIEAVIAMTKAKFGSTGAQVHDENGQLIGHTLRLYFPFVVTPESEKLPEEARKDIVREYFAPCRPGYQPSQRILHLQYDAAANIHTFMQQEGRENPDEATNCAA